MSPGQRRRYLRDSIPPLADRIERLVPALAGDGPNLEYPWAVPNANPATVRPPSRHDFPITESEIERIMKFLRTLLSTCS